MKTISLKTISSIVFLFVLLICTSCADSKLKIAVAVANKECPVELEGVGTVTSVEYEGNNVIYNCVVGSESPSIDEYRALRNSVKTAILNSLASSTDKDVKDLLKLIADSGSNLVYKLIDNQGKSIEFTLTPEEIKNAKEVSIANNSTGRTISSVDGDEIDYSSFDFDELVNLSNENIAGEGSCHKEGRNLVLVLQLGSNDASVDDIRYNKQEFKNTILEGIGPGIDPMFEVLAAQNRDLIYRYTDNYGNSADIRVTSSEIKRRLQGY